MVTVPIGTIPNEYRKECYTANDTNILQLQDVSDYYNARYNYFFIFGTNGVDTMIYGIGTWRPEWSNKKTPELDTLISKNISIVATNLIGTIQFSVEHTYFKVWPIME